MIKRLEGALRHATSLAKKLDRLKTKLDKIVQSEGIVVDDESQDYTHYVDNKSGFSVDVDKMLIKASKANSCPEREKCVLLLLDEMHIRQQLVFDKHSGSIIGYVNISEIVNHLAEFEERVSNDTPSPKIAKTMTVFMVQGLFSSLQFPYPHFPGTDVSGEMLYDPFWEAVRRIENCGLKVCHTILTIQVFSNVMIGAWCYNGWLQCQLTSG